MDTKHEALELAILCEEVAMILEEERYLDALQIKEAAILLRRQHARIEELELALNGASNYIDTLGGVSQRYRCIANRKD